MIADLAGCDPGLWEPRGGVHRAAFIDRDGVICRNRDDYVKSWSEFVFLRGALKSLARLARLRLRIVVITNQSIINRHIVPVQVVEDIHARMAQTIAEAGGRIDRVMYCPHRPDEHCTCRKPEPGLLLQAAEELGLDLQGSYLIGDAETDMQAGRAVGCHRYLVLTGRGRRQLIRCWRHGEAGFTVVPNLGAAVNAIVRCEGGRTTAASVDSSSKEITGGDGTLDLSKNKGNLS